jgi:pyridoxal phosphate-dependent aminotransferase EpsN
VICPDFTFVAAANPVRYLGAEPVLVDVEKDSWGMDPGLLESAIKDLNSAGRMVRAIVVVHAYGIPAPIERIMKISQHYHIPVLEDCAGAIGTLVGGRHVGTFGDAATFSFNGNKILTTSSGGAVIFRNPDLYEKTRSWANQGKPAKAIGYVHDSLGYNYKLSNVCAAIGLGQLHTLEDRLGRKVAIRAAYEEFVSRYPNIDLMPDPPYGRRNNWMMALGMPGGRSAMDAIMAFRSNGIEASPMWSPLHQMPFNRQLQRFGGEVANDILQRYICLPSGTRLNRADVERICAVFAKLLG